MTENTTAVQILMEDIFQLREICSPLNTIKPLKTLSLLYHPTDWKLDFKSNKVLQSK